MIYSDFDDILNYRASCPLFRRLNVAITRGRHMVWVLGNARMLAEANNVGLSIQHFHDHITGSRMTRFNDRFAGGFVFMFQLCL